MNNNYIKLVILIVLLSAVALSPSFNAGELKDKDKYIEIRAEDILLALFISFSFLSFLAFGKKEIEKPPMFLIICLWLGFSFVSLLINFILNNMAVDRGLFYLLKEVEFFFLFFYIFYLVKDIKTAKISVFVWLILIALNTFFVIFQIVFKIKWGEYGSRAISEWGAFPTGAFFLISFVFFFNIFLYYFFELNISKTKKAALGFLSFIPIIGVFGSGSKTNFLSLFFVLFLTFLFAVFKKRNLKLFLLMILIAAVVVLSFLIINLNLPKTQRLASVLSFEEALFSFEKARYERVIGPEFEKAKERPLYIYLFGIGKGYGETHNQYLRNFVETGIMGSLIFLIMIFLILKTSFKEFLKSVNIFITGISSGLLVATLCMIFMSFATEPFLVVKPAEVYWIFAAIAMASFKLIKEDNEIQ
ncbi:MAG: O-antigen ligase family protein [Candidatus Pacebacteria bacterium]|nr:O-antigen ligase family protein [Candidatus Paceibacterota bacterium]